MHLVLRFRRIRVMQIHVERHADGLAEVDPTAVFVPTSGRDRVEGEENVGLDEFDAFGAGGEGSAGFLASVFDGGGVEVGTFIVVSGGDSADCGGLKSASE